MIRQTKTAIKELTAQYRAVLKRAFLAGVAAVAVMSTANADGITTWTEGAKAISDWMDGLADSSEGTWDRNDGPVTGYGVDTILNMLSPVFAEADSKTTLAEVANSIRGVGYQTTLQSNWSDLNGYTVDSDFKTSSTYGDGTLVVTGSSDGSSVFADSYTYTLVGGLPSNVSEGKTTATSSVSLSAYNRNQSSMTSISSDTDGWEDTALDFTDYGYTTAGGVTYGIAAQTADDGTTVFRLTESSVVVDMESLTDAQQDAWDILNKAFDADKGVLETAIGNVSTDLTANEKARNAAQSAYQQDVKVSKALDAYKNANDTYANSLGAAVDAHVLDSQGAVVKAVTGLISDKEVLISKDLGYNIADPDNETTGLVARLDALTGAEGEDVSLVGAINANTDAIDDVRAEATEAYTHAHNWAEYVTGLDVDEDRETQLQTALNKLATADSKSNTIGSDNIAGALHELDGDIQGIRAEATEAYTHAHNWAEYVTGLDVDESRETQLQTALNKLATADSKSNTIGSDNIAGALHELDGDIQGVDAKVGEIKDLQLNMQTRQQKGEYNVASDRYATVEDHLIALAGAIGNRTTLSGDYVSDTDVATNLQSLNNGVEANADAIETLNGDATTEGSVAHAIAGEAAQRIAADEILKNDIIEVANFAVAEQAARKQNDELLATAIDNVNNGSISRDVELATAIADEITRAKGAEEAIQQDLIARDAATLNSANAYTDKQVESLEKNMSAGIASAAALSSVEVSNVKKGEVSVGGGYGYHNNQSAVAFGAAMGLSDNWSMNAGVGMGFNDSSNVTVRAGTNYKFKLF